MLKALVLVGLLGGVAHADMTEAQKTEARSHFETGNTHFNLGEFDQAIVEFKAAYEISSAPGLLYNIAQSYRLKKDFEQASMFYKTYLRLKPDAANRAEVEQRITEMDKLVAEQKANAVSPPHDTIPPDGPKAGDATKPAADPTKPPADGIKPPPPATPHVDEDALASAHTLQTAGYATAGAGAALLVTGFVFGGMASSNQKDLNALSPNMGTWDAAARAKYDAGNRDNTIAIISFVAGGAAIATGGVLWYLGYTKHAHATSVAIVPTPAGTMATVGFRF
jgi:iron complex outermembrane receptor protein